MTFEDQELQRESVENRLRVTCSRAEVEQMVAHLATVGEPTSSMPSSWPSFHDWMSVNGCPAELMAGQHRVEALKLFQKKNQLHTSLDEDPLWWLCDIYDRGRLPTPWTVE
jgi:hypothetical protein